LLRLPGRRPALLLSPPLRLAPPPLPASQCIERPVARDRQYPGNDRPPPRCVLVRVAPHLHEHVAHDLLRLVLIPQDAKCETEEPGRQYVVQLGQRALVVRLETARERALLLLTKTFRQGHLDSG